MGTTSGTTPRQYMLILMSHLHDTICIDLGWGEEGGGIVTRITNIHENITKTGKFEPIYQNLEKNQKISNTKKKYFQKKKSIFFLSLEREAFFLIVSRLVTACGATKLTF